MTRCYTRAAGPAHRAQDSVRRYSTIIAIGIAVALATAIVAVGARAPGGGTGGPGTAETTLPAGHPNPEDGPQSGMVDTAALDRDISALERAHEANPDSVRIALSLGDAYYAAQRLDDAAGAYGEALQVSPGHPTATVRMAMVWHARGDDDRAIGLIDGVLAELPDQQEALYNLAIIRFARQEVAAAKEAWARAAKADPTSRLGIASKNFVDLLSDDDGSASH